MGTNNIIFWFGNVFTIAHVSALRGHVIFQVGMASKGHEILSSSNLENQTSFILFSFGGQALTTYYHNGTK